MPTLGGTTPPKMPGGPPAKAGGSPTHTPISGRTIPFSPPPTRPTENENDTTDAESSEPPMMSNGAEAGAASDMGSQRAIQKNTLKKESAETEKEIENLKTQLAGIMGGGFGWSVFKTVFPAIAGKINDVYSGAKKGSLEASVIALKTVRGTLVAAKSGAGIIDAGKNTWTLVTAGFALAVIPGIILFILSPMIFLVISVVYLALGLGTFAKFVGQLVKKIDALIAPLEQELQKQRRSRGLEKKERN